MARLTLLRSATCHAPVKVTLPGAAGGAGAAPAVSRPGATDGRMAGASAAAAPANENGVGLDESTVASPGCACAATGTSLALQPRTLGPDTGLPIVSGIDFMSPHTAPVPAGRRARALSVRFPVRVTKT